MLIGTGGRLIDLEVGFWTFRERVLDFQGEGLVLFCVSGGSLCLFFFFFDSQGFGISGRGLWSFFLFLREKCLVFFLIFRERVLSLSGF